MRVNGEALQLHIVYKKGNFYYKSRENLYQVLQVTHTASERSMKSKVRMIKSFPSTKLYQKKNHLFVAVGNVTRAVRS